MRRLWTKRIADQSSRQPTLYVSAWGKITNGGAPSLDINHNIASVSLVTVGVVKITFAKRFQTPKSYAAVATVHAATHFAVISLTSRTFCRVTTLTDTGAAQNQDFSFIAFGRFASGAALAT